MFTGIVRELGNVASVQRAAGGLRLELDAHATAAQAGIGDSVAINGCCLTVVARTARTLSFEAVPETLARTSLGGLAAGDAVNVEPALRAGEPLGGHIVQGHVDGVGQLVGREPDGDGERLRVQVPRELLRYIVEKGSVTLEGVSLTVASLESDGFGVALIPHTLAVTTLGVLAPGASLNLEVDVLAKYVERLLAQR